MRLQDKTALVTGGARGIGRAIAESFVREGARVVLADLNADQAAASAADLNGVAAGSAHSVGVDVARSDACAKAQTEAEAFFGAPDILVCAAGIGRPAAPLEEISPETWDHVLAINLMGCVHPTTAFVPAAKARGSGRIVYIASVAGQVGGVAAEVTYTVSKAGVLAFGKAMARQLAAHKITVNCIAPGAVRTDMTAVFEYGPSVRAGIPLGDYGHVDDIAAAALYLASEDGRYMTGATMDVNGGLLMR
ncbi:MAG: SDR family NAD(P)-dependent oxidoreductase [Pseudomonadota bacterium]